MGIYKAFTTSILIALVLGVVYVNSAYAQTIETGDAEAGTVIENQVNTNIIRCCTPTPTKPPEESPTPTPTTEQPTPTPTEKPGDGGGGDGGGVGGPSGEAPKQGEVLGAQVLAPTGNFPSDLATIQQVLGLGLLSSGLVYGRIIRKKK